ncbi:MAG: DNA methyltransferase [Candidatus Helarchaeota archaeon]
MKVFNSDTVLAKFQKLKIDKNWSFSNYKPSETGKWTHNFHRYPAKFIPQLVEKLFDKYLPSNETQINDPFYGCGTTIVTAISRGIKANGTDINKIAHLITRVKSRPIEPHYLNKEITTFLSRVENLKNKQGSLIKDRTQSLIPKDHVERINYWFKKDNVKNLGYLLSIIQEHENEMVRDFLLVAFSQILKNCSIWLQKSSKPTRDMNKIPADPYILIRRQLKKMERGNNSFYQVVPDKVKNNLEEYLMIKIGDARAQPVEDESIDLIVTSSPYVTSYEYADLHQLSTIWLNYTNDLSEYKKKFIGSTFNKNTIKALKSEIASQIVDKLKSKSKKLSREVNSYFKSMEEVFEESFRILKHGGRCCYVIGNTKLKGVEILNAQVFAESLCHSGFKLDNIIKREIPSKILPQYRDEKTGRFSTNKTSNIQAYPVEFIIIGFKE